jgi:hypothetical protein
VFGGPAGLNGVPDSLYENLGDGRFRDISESSGITQAKPSYGLGVVILDFDQDGRQDIFVGNDSMPDFCGSTRAACTSPTRGWRWDSL